MLEFIRMSLFISAPFLIWLTLPVLLNWVLGKPQPVLPASTTAASPSAVANRTASVVDGIAESKAARQTASAEPFVTESATSQEDRSDVSAHDTKKSRADVEYQELAVVGHDDHPDFSEFRDIDLRPHIE